MAIQFNNSSIKRLIKQHSSSKALCNASEATLPRRIYLICFISILLIDYLLLFGCVVPFVDDLVYVLALAI